MTKQLPKAKQPIISAKELLRSTWRQFRKSTQKRIIKIEKGDTK